MRFILEYNKWLSESDDPTKELSKSSKKREIWHSQNPSPIGLTLRPSELEKYGIPNSIIEEMKKWPVIYKSPYSKSFYSSTDINWSSKPDGSYRVSDHWNFLSKGKRHCITKNQVKDNTHFSLGKYSKLDGTYEILLSEYTQSHSNKISKNTEKLVHLKDPDTIYKKQIFKKRVNDGEVFILLYKSNGETIEGIVDKYGGNDLRIKNDKGEVIFTSNYINSLDRKEYSISLFDKDNNTIEDPYRF